MLSPTQYGILGATKTIEIDHYMNGILLFHLFWEIWGITAKDGD